MAELKQGYAYRDKYGILHIVPSIGEAQEYASGEIKEVECLFDGGYPKVEYDGKLLDIVDYGDGDIYVDGNKNSGDTCKLVNVEEGLAAAVRAVLDGIGL